MLPEAGHDLAANLPVARRDWAFHGHEHALHVHIPPGLRNNAQIPRRALLRVGTHRKSVVREEEQ